MPSGKYIRTEKMKQNMRKPKTKEHAKHIGDSRRGIPCSEEQKQLLRKYRLNTTTPEEVKLKISKSMIGKNTWMKGRTGEKSTRWEGGITPLNTMIRHSDKYKEWKIQVFGRDNFTCRECGIRGTWLEAHHKKRFSIIIKDNNIKTFEAALTCSELWDIENGITLCKKCHNETKRTK